MDYQSPGGAFTSAFADAELQRTQLARQAMLDDLHRRQVEGEIAQGQAALAEKRQEHADILTEKERNQTVTDVAGLVPGDIPDPDLVARAQKHHVPLRVTPAEAPVAATEAPPASIAAPDQPAPQNPALVTPPGTGVLATPPRGAIRFAGSPQFAAQEAQRARAQTFIDSLPDGDPRKTELKSAFEAEAAGLKVPPGYFAKQTTPTTDEAVFRQNPASGKVERLQNGSWVGWNGDVPKGAHFMTVPDHSASDAARAAAADRQLQTVQEHAYTELNKWAAPIEGHLSAIRSLGTMLNAKTPEADKLVAPLVIKATIAGQGSGFRMTRAEIESVVGGRSHWETLQAALQQWSLDPTKALSLTDSQRNDLRDLTKAIRNKATTQARQITDARHQIDDATDVQTINRARTKLQERLSQDDTDDGTTGSTGDTLTVGGTFNGQKILAVRPAPPKAQ